MLAFNAGRAIVDPTTLDTEEGFSETISDIMVDAVLKKRQEAGADLTLLAEKHHATARKRITNSKTLNTGFWVLGYVHHLGTEAVEISNRKNKNEKVAELGKLKQANENSKQFDDEVKRVCTELPPEKMEDTGKFLR
jgi:hypothetical protein